MLNKKLLLGVVALSLLPMFSAGASVSMDDEGDSDLIYLRLGYQGTYVGFHTIDAAKEARVAGTSYSVLTDDYKPKYDFNFMGGSIGIGKTFSSDTRAELEVSANTQVEIDNVEGLDYFDNLTTPAAFMNKGFKFGVAALNLYYDFDAGKQGFMPYIGGGIGIARVNFLSSPTSETITYPIALQFKAGIQMKLNNVMPIYLGYKLIYLAQKESDSILSTLPAASPGTTTAGVTTGATVALTTKMKSSYMLHNLDLGIMIVK